MKRFVLILTTAALLCSAFAAEADAAGKKRRILRWLLRSPRPAPRTDYDKHIPYYDPYDPYAKYYGGFHSRHLTDLGIPPGDRGLRGNGGYWAPW